jgi:hypothetical protein
MGYGGLKGIPVGDDGVQAIAVFFENKRHDLMTEFFRHCDLVVGSGGQPRPLHLKVGYKRFVKTHMRTPYKVK